MTDQTVDLVVLHADDNVGTALRALEVATAATVSGTGGQLPPVTLGASIPFAHKAALRPIACGELVIKHGHPIGRATADIAAGEHVHVHNVVSLSMEHVL